MIPLDHLRTSIDAFRGEVSFSVPLGKLPGDDQPRFDIHAVYRSDVQATVQADNLRRPTGVLGLGWSLPIEWIGVEPSQSVADAQQHLTLTSSAGRLRLVHVGVAADGAWLYATEDYRFWQIRRYVAEERWEIVREDGTLDVFGDRASGAQSVAWAVAWDNWIGASHDTAGQRQVAVGWFLWQRRDPWGHVVTNDYAQVTSATGTADGLPYTQAIYLSRIVRQDGHAELQYVEKETFEYQDPHTNPPPPNAWQDRFDTRALAAIVYYNADGSLRSQVAFDYTDGHGHLQFIGSGAMAKRLLMAIRVSSPGAAPLPGVAFTYVTDTASASLGALHSVTVPEGGVVTYGYAAPLAIGHGQRDLVVVAPEKTGVTFSQPRFWFQDYYVVVSWLGSDNTAQIVSYTWEGQWVASTLMAVPLANAGAYPGVRASLATSTFGVLAADKLAVYQRDDNSVGQWLGTPQPITLDLTSGEAASLVCGDHFVAALGLTSATLNRVHWNGVAWITDPVVHLPASRSPVQCALAADRDFIFASSTAQQDTADALHLSCFFLDAVGSWQTTTLAVERPLAVVTGLAVAVAPTYAIVTATGPSGGNVDAIYLAIDWSAGFTPLSWSQLTAITVAAINAVPVAMIGESFVGIGGELFRWNGLVWTRQNSDSITYPNEQAVSAISYGVDQILRTIGRTDGSVIYDLLGYDPNIPDGTPPWSVPSNMAGLAPTGTTSFVARAARGGEAGGYVIYPVQNETNWFNGLYVQQPSGAWQSVLQIPDLLSATDAASLQVLNDRYCIYQSGADAVIYPLANGTVAGAGAIRLTGQRVTVPDADAGALIGSRAFISYTGTWNDPAAVLTLHRVVGQAVSGAQQQAPVVTMQSNFGYETLASVCGYTAATATMAENGERAAYNEVTLAAGTVDAATAPHGTTQRYFFNDLAPGQSPSLLYPTGDATNAPQWLKRVRGLTYATRMLTAPSETPPRDVSDTTWFWWVFPQTLSSAPTDARRGFYARVQRTTMLLDGVTQQVDMAYSTSSAPPVTGLPVQMTTSQFNSAGTRDTLTETFTYFWEQYDPNRTLNLLMPIVRTVAATNGVTTSIQITTWRNDWSSNPGPWAIAGSFVATQADPAPFNQWTPSTDPLATGWRAISVIASRTASGQIRESADTLGRVTSVLFDEAGGKQVAYFFNASLSHFEADYYGFEPYEALRRWRYTQGSIRDHIVTITSHTGLHSLQIDPVTSATVGPTATFLPTTGSRSFLFSCWMQTPPGFDTTAGAAQWELSIYAVGQSQPLGTPQIVAFPATNSAWTYVHAIVDLEAIRKANPSLPPETPLSLTILGYNQKTGLSCWADELRFSPLDAEYRAWVYDPVRGVISASLAENGATLRMVRDVYARVIATVGPDENVAATSVTTPARMLSSDDTFNASLPNRILRVTGAASGIYSDFQPIARAAWDLPNNNWSIANRALQYTGTSTGPLGSQATLRDFAQAEYVAQVQVHAQAAPGATFNAGLGTGNIVVYWDQTASAWTLTYPGESGPVTITRSGAFGQSWCFGVIAQLVLFYVDGVEIFSYVLPSTVVSQGKFQVMLTAPGSFSDLVIVTSPRAAYGFLDGGGRAQQAIALIDAQQVVAIGTIYDDLARPQYARNPIKVPLKIQQPAGSGAMASNQARILANIGDYLPYIDGQQLTLAQYLAPANGSPFAQWRYETSPVSRQLEASRQGTAFAMGSEHTQRMLFGTNVSDGPMEDLIPPDTPGRASGSYFVRTLTDENGVASYQMFNEGGQLLAQRVALGTMPETYQSVQYVYDSAGLLKTVRLPNSFTSQSSAGSTDWQIQRSYSFLGDLLSEDTPDAGLTQYAYDSAGRLRFSLDQAGASQPGAPAIKYIKYDMLDRPIEEGLIQNSTVTWTVASGHVDDQNWPDSTVTPIAFRTNIYDDDGKAATQDLVGRLWQATIHNPSAGTNDVQTFAYDRRGQIVATQTTAASFDAQTYASSYAYTNTGELSRVTYPALVETSSALSQETPFNVLYAYDRLGQLTGVATSDEAQPAARITSVCEASCNAFGQVEHLHLNAAGRQAIDRTYSYDPRNWPVGIDGDYVTQALTYDQGGVNNAGYFNGQLASSMVSYRATPGMDPWNAPVVSQGHWRYQYDPLNRLQIAASDQQEVNAALGFGDPGTPASYDPNGNLLVVPRGPATETYVYTTSASTGSGDTAATNNRVQQVTCSINAAIRFESSVPYPGWSWGSSNAGPSGSHVAPPTSADPVNLPNGQALELVGGSLGHYELLQFQGYLAPQGQYTLSYWLKAPDPFGAQEGPAGWLLRFFSDRGPIVDVLLRDCSQSVAEWQAFTIPDIDLAAIVSSMTLDPQIVTVALVLVNGKLSTDSSPGASLFVADIALTGSGTKGQFGYTYPDQSSAAGRVTRATNRNIDRIDYDPLTGNTSAVAMSGNQAQRIAYAYGADGSRQTVVQTFPDTRVSKAFYLQGPDGKTLMEVTDDGQMEARRRYIYGPTGLLAADTSSGLQYLLDDTLGSIRAAVGDDGVVQAMFDYGPFGELIKGPLGVDQPFRYTGQPEDAGTGVYNYQARLYDPALRRFYAPDPAQEEACSYAYVGNDPINATDPTGQFIIRMDSLRRLPQALAFFFLSPRFVYYTGTIYSAITNLIAWFLSRDDFEQHWLGGRISRFTDPDRWKGLYDDMPHKVFKNFSRRELLVMMKYYPWAWPIATPIAMGLLDKLLPWTRGVVPAIYEPVQRAVDRAWDGQQKGNAVRHVSWMCYATRFFGEGDQFAMELGEAHEHGRPGSIYDQIADRINNAISLYLAKATSADCADIANDAWGQGILARNANFVNGAPNLSELQEILASWETGLNFLDGKNYTPLFNDDDREHLAWARATILKHGSGASINGTASVPLNPEDCRIGVNPAMNEEALCEVKPV